MKRGRLPLAFFLVLLLYGCASANKTSYKAADLGEITLNEINGFLEDGKPEQAVQYITALRNGKFDLDKALLDKAYEQSVRRLRAQFEEAFDDGDFRTALSKYYSLKSIKAEIPLEGITDIKLKLLLARQYIENDNPIPGITLFQRILSAGREHDGFVGEDELLSFGETALREKNRALGRAVAGALEAKGLEVPEDLAVFTEKDTGFKEMVGGTVTIWVNRGLKIEGGVGYPDRAIGSGFFIDRRGYLLTNYHVISSEVDPEYEGFSRLYVRLSQKPEEKIPAKVIGWDEVFDIALLKTEINPSYIFSLSDEQDFNSGETIYAIGSPIGLENTVTSGIISAVGRRFLQLGDTIQVDVPVNVGNSGGPLLNKEEKLVGVVFAGIKPYEGINFAIPAYYIHFILPQLYDGGKVIHPWLGAAVKKVDKGFEVMYALPGEPADNASIEQGDTILKINNRSFSTLRELQEEIIRYQPRTLVSVTWLNAEGKEKIGYFSLNPRPNQPMDLAIKRDRRDKLITPLFGMQLEETDTVFWKPNYLVRRVYRGSIADESGLSENDPVSIQRWEVDRENRIALLQLYVMKRTAGFLEKAVQLAAYLDIDNFI